MRLSLTPETGGLLGKVASLARLVRHSGTEPRRGLGIAIALTTVATLADFAALGAISQGAARLVPDSAGGRGADARILAGFLLAALIGSVLRLVALRQMLATHGRVHRVLAIKAFNVLQRQGYETYLRHGASQGFATFERLQILASTALPALVSLAVALLGAVLLSGAVLWLHPVLGVVLFAVLAAVVVEPFWRASGRSTAPVSDLSQSRARLIYEARTLFRDIFMANGQDRMCEDFAIVETTYRTRQTQLAVSAQSSRSVIEVAGFVAALLTVGIVARSQQPWQMHVAMVGVMALAAMRLVPQAAIIRASLRTIAEHGEVTRDVMALLEHPGTPVAAASPSPTVVLRREIRLVDVTVRREDRPVVLDRLNLVIPRGSRIGIAGASGVGKSTLLDVICGATLPHEGAVYVDDVRIDEQSGREWRDRIGVVSQSPSLFGNTLGEAIVFPLRPQDGEPEILATSIRLAGIDAMTSTFPRGLDTAVGEALTHLSGGQRQRLAFAHALFRARDLLVLDEATGHLDSDSEQTILEAIRLVPKHITIVIVSHREAMFDCCDTVYRLDQGRLALDRRV